MKKIILKNRAAISVALILIASCLAFAQHDATPQQKAKRPSPPATAQCKFSDGKTINVDYSQPSMKGRKIYGGLVPYDQVWRTGANEATTFVTTADAEINGTTVPAGSYTLYTLPSAGTWKLIINKQTGQWGTQYDEQQDLARIDMQKSQTEQPVEQFTISFKKKSDNAADLVMEWENLRLTVPVKLQ